MKTQINNENKVKFFSLYWGQNLIDCDKYSVPVELKSILVNMPSTWFESIIGQSKILLKPLSQISDEDAWGVGLRVNCWSKWERRKDWFTSKEDDFHKVHILSGKSFSDAIGKELGHGHSHPFANNSTDILDAYDYLRSKGYALPWMGLSVEEMIEAGWIKLTSS